jgi:hypothetical protein
LVVDQVGILVDGSMSNISIITRNSKAVVSEPLRQVDRVPRTLKDLHYVVQSLAPRPPRS